MCKQGRYLIPIAARAWVSNMIYLPRYPTYLDMGKQLGRSHIMNVRVMPKEATFVKRYPLESLTCEVKWSV